MKLETDRLQIRYIEETDWKSVKEIWESARSLSFVVVCCHEILSSFIMIL